MTSISAIHFVCSCGRKLSAKPEQAGKSYACPGCSKMIEVPSLAVAASAYVKPGAPAEPASPPVTRFARWLTQTPTSFRDFFSLIAMGWALVAVVSAVMILIGGWLGWVGLLLLLLATAAALHQCWLLVHARQRVLGTKDLPLFWGLIRMIAWDPTEGVLILRNKQVHFSDDDLHDGNGGVRFLYSILGEELALRVPLEVQTLQFSDDNILTREYLSLRVRGSVKWRIHDIRKFYLLVSRELRSTGELNPKGKPATPATHVSVGDEHAQGTLNRLVRSAVEWLRGLAEEQTRITFSRVSSGLLIANRITEQLPEVKGLTEPHRDAPEEFAGTTASLASQLMTALAERVADYGILVQDISLEEVQFPAAILDQASKPAKPRICRSPLSGRRWLSMPGCRRKSSCLVARQSTIESSSKRPQSLHWWTLSLTSCARSCRNRRWRCMGRHT